MFVQTLRRLWFLFLALFRSKPKQMSKTVLPLSSNKARLVGKPLSLPHQRDPTHRRGSSLTSTCGRFTGSHHQISPHLNSHPQSNPQDLPSDGLPSNGHPHSHRGFSPYSLILPDRPPPRPPRPQSISVSVSEDEFGTPVISDVRLPSVIVTPCTPSTKAGRKYIGTSGLDESNSDGESSGSDANSCITSVDSNPFLSDPSPTLQKEFYIPPLGPRTNYHHRARSLTGTARGLRHQRLSRSETFIRGHPLSFSPQSRVAKTVTSTSPVEKSDSPLLIKAAVAPSANKTSFIRSRPNVVWDSASQAITDQRIRSYMTSISSERSTDQTLVQDFTLDPTSASTRHSEDPTAHPTASCVAQPALLASTVMDQLSAPSSLTPSVHGHALLGLVSYTEVFDLDAYFDSDSTLPTESTLNASCSTINSNESRNPFLSPTTPSSPNCSSSAIVIPQPKPIRRVSNISDTTASSTSIYTYSLSHKSTDTDGSTSTSTSTSASSSNNNPRRFGFIRITDNGRKNKETFDHEVKRYRDHYRPPAYSRSPAFVIESPTTSRKFIGKRESDGISITDRVANKETFSSNLLISTPTRAYTKLPNPISLPTPSCPYHVHNAPDSTDNINTGTRRLVRRDRQESLPFRNQQTTAAHTPDSSTTVGSVSESPVGKNFATRHRLGSLAITQRRRM